MRSVVIMLRAAHVAQQPLPHADVDTDERNSDSVSDANWLSEKSATKSRSSEVATC